MRTILALFTLILAFGCTSEVVKNDNCGDGVLDSGEECDDNEFGGATCENFGYYGGTIYCSIGCTIDKSACVAVGRCGDGIIQYSEGEECDGSNFGNATCLDEGYSAGELACDDSCKLIIDGCNSQCTVDQIFFNSPNPNCAPTSQCVIDATGMLEHTFSLSCVPEEDFADVLYYSPCGDTPQPCPHGAICAPILGRSLCMPLCHGIYNPVCPSNGVCVVEADAADGNTGLCFRPDVCDPIMDTGCNTLLTNKHCYLLDDEGHGLCMDFTNPELGISGDGDLPTHGEDCRTLSGEYDACQAGNVCLSYLFIGLPDRCARLCHPGSDAECDTGETCISIGVGWLGACFAQ